MLPDSYITARSMAQLNLACKYRVPEPDGGIVCPLLPLGPTDATTVLAP